MSKRTRILVLSANPQETSRLRLDQEVREIEAGLRRSKNRDQFELISRWAVRPRDIQRALLDTQPNIIHFSGHGAGDEGLLFEDEEGRAKLVEGQALARLFDLFSDEIECVVLNGCYSEVQASSIAQYIDNVVGMSQAVSDRAAIEFSVGFYDALGDGRSIDFAYKFGRNAIEMAGVPENLIPVLKQRQTLSNTFNLSDSSIANITGSGYIQYQPDLSSNVGKGIQLFLSYAHEDESWKNELEKHLKLLQRQNIISVWHDRVITAGSNWSDEISEHLEAAQVILLLISADFIASDYCYEIEMKTAMERHSSGKARVIPIILRSVDWVGSPFSKLQALPKNAKPVSSWDSTDLALTDIAQGIRLVCEELRSQDQVREAIAERGTFPSELVPQTSEVFPIFEVFKTSGVPTITFVEPEKFHLIKLALMQPGVGVVIEGPSGIGKTTALKKALEETIPEDKDVQIFSLSARKPKDLSRIKTIRQWHSGVAVVDDFHRLSIELQEMLVDYLKYLADNELPKKLIIVGIPSTGKRLVNLAFDIAMRVKFFRLGRVRDEIVLKMINRGEAALNIVFERKSDIVRSANGSLNVAQSLCYHLVAREGFVETQSNTEIISGDIEIVISEVMSNEMALKFDDTVRSFAALDDHTERTCIEILKELSHSSEGFLSLKQIQDSRPELSSGIESFIEYEYITRLYEKCPDSQNYLVYDNELCALVVDDPQLGFYLSNTPFDRLSKLVGKT
ncbi:MAG: TIR domain-containing protein [Phormidesmis sp.]